MNDARHAILDTSRYKLKDRMNRTLEVEGKKLGFELDTDGTDGTEGETVPSRIMMAREVATGVAGGWARDGFGRRGGGWVGGGRTGIGLNAASGFDVLHCPHHGRRTDDSRTRSPGRRACRISPGRRECPTVPAATRW